MAETVILNDLIDDMEDINSQFSQTDKVLLISANDMVNSAAKTDPKSPAEMPGFL